MLDFKALTKLNPTRNFFILNTYSSPFKKIKSLFIFKKAMQNLKINNEE